MAKARLRKATQLPEMELLGLLERLAAVGSVTCPYSLWQIVETAAYDADDERDEIVRIVETLSGGRCFKWAYDLVLDEMAVAVDASIIGGRAPAVAPLGDGLDCFPRDVILPRTRALAAALGRAKGFAASVAMGRESEELRNAAAKMNNALFGAETAAAAARSEVRISLAAARKLEAHAVVNGGFVTAWVTRTASEQDLPRHEVRKLILRDSLAHVPTLAMMVEIRARRDVQFDRPPKENDPSDVGHLLTLPYCDWFLTDNHAAALARDAGKPRKIVVLSKPDALVDQLRKRYPD